MNILISGSTGLVGRKLVAALTQAGHTTEALKRADFSGPPEQMISKINRADVVVNLAGAPILARWTNRYKKEILDSRITTTQMIARAIEKAGSKPGMLISASAVGIYDDGQPCTEKDFRYGDDFLADVCRQWEAEAMAVNGLLKVAVFRIGIVLADDGGALPKMALPFRMGFGGRIGNGKQGFSWIHIDDLVRAFGFVIEKQLTGIFNLTAPEYTDNSGLTAVISKVLRRPAFFPVPEPALRLLYGEGATALTRGQNVLPQRLLDEGFAFRYPELEPALYQLFGK